MNEHVVDIENYKLDLEGINLKEDYERFLEDDWIRDNTQIVNVPTIYLSEGLVSLEFTEEKGYLTVSIDPDLKKIVE